MAHANLDLRACPPDFLTRGEGGGQGLMLNELFNMDGKSPWTSKFCHSCGLALEKGFNYCPKCGQEVISDGKSSVKHGSHLNGNRTVENVVSSNAGTTATARSASTARVHAPSNKKSAKPYPPLECFSAFKKSKEKERSSFFVRKKGSKRSKSETIVVKITVAVMENNKVKRGNSLPLKVPAASTADEILNAAVQKHTAYNKHFNSRHKYVLVFKDGTKVETIPGTTPPPGNFYPV